MKHFGLYLTETAEKLVDLDTGEILAETAESKQKYLQSLQDNRVEYSLQFI